MKRRPVLSFLLWSSVLFVFAYSKNLFQFSPGFFLVSLTILIGWFTTLLVIDSWIRSPRFVAGGTIIGLILLLFVPIVRSTGAKDLLGLIVVLGIGVLLSECFRESGHIIPIFFLAAVCDSLSMSISETPTARIKQEAPIMLDWFSFEYPIPGTDRWIPILGFSDWLILTVGFRVSYREGLSTSRVFRGALAGLLVLLFATWITNPDPALPALPFIALGVAFNFRESMSRMEGFYKALGVGIVVFLFSIVLVFLSR